MGNLWMREIKVAVGGASYAYPPWHLKGSIQFDVKSEAGTATVELYNLSAKTIATFQRNQVVKIEAGHTEAKVLPIFVGVLDQHTTVWKGTEKITTIKAHEDREKTLLKRVPGKSWGPGARAKDVIRDLFTVGGLRPGKIEDGGLTYEKGKQFDPSFTVHKALEEMKTDVSSYTKEKYEWHTRMGTGYFVKEKTVTGGTFTVTPETGLIGSPQRAEVETKDVDMEGTDKPQWHVMMVLRPDIEVGGKLIVKSRKEPCEGKILSGQHVFSPDGQFQTTVVIEG